MHQRCCADSAAAGSQPGASPPAAQAQVSGAAMPGDGHQEPLTESLERSTGMRGLPDAEAHLATALGAGTVPGLQAAIRYAVRAIAAANPGASDLSQVGSAHVTSFGHQMDTRRWPSRCGDKLLKCSCLCKSPCPTHQRRCLSIAQGESEKHSLLSILCR